MKRLPLSLAIAALAALAVVATVSAADPSPTPAPAQDQVRSRDTISSVLGLTQAQVRDLRHDGLTLAQIAQQRRVDVQKLIDALVAQWRTRIDARVANGALTDAQATTLRTQLEVRAKAMVSQTTPGGMRGAAVGAGVGGQMRGVGAGAAGADAGAGPYGDGTCDGTGPHGRQGRTTP